MEDWIPVESSFIKAVSLCVQSRVFGFRVGDDELFIEVSNPKIDPEKLLSSFLRSPSKGKFFNDVFLKRKSVLAGRKRIS